MINFFDKYRDLFDVDQQTIIPTARLTSRHPLFNQQPTTLPLKDLKLGPSPIDFTKQLDTFEAKLESWKKDRQRQSKPMRISSPLKLGDSPYNGRPSSRKRSVLKSSLASQLDKLNELDNMLQLESSSSFQESSLPVIRKISSYEVQNSSKGSEPREQIKPHLIKRKLSTKSQIPVSIPTKQSLEIQQEKRRWTIEQMKLHKPTISTNAFALNRRNEAQRNLRARQNKLRAALAER